MDATGATGMETLEGREAVQEAGSKTNLFTAMQAKENSSVVKKLAVFTVLMAVLPLAAFFYARDVLMAQLDVEPRKRDFASALIAVAVVNTIIMFYVLMAFFESVQEENENQQTKKQQ